MKTKKKCIVVIDDNEDFRNILLKYLTDIGYRVIEAENGLEGFYKIRELDITPDLFIIDIIMDTLDGIDTYRLIKDNENLMNVPIIMISGSERGEKINKVLNEEVIFLSKPIVFSQLSSKIKELLSKEVIRNEDN